MKRSIKKRKKFWSMEEMGKEMEVIEPVRCTGSCTHSSRSSASTPIEKPRHPAIFLAGATADPTADTYDGASLGFRFLKGPVLLRDRAAHRWLLLHHHFRSC